MTADLTNPIFTNEDKAREHLEALLWPNGPVCPHCREADADKLRKLEGDTTRPGLYQCNSCRGHFTVTVGTVFERSHVPLNKWVLAFHLMASSKKGMSAHQLHRMLGVTYKTAWFMAHRIRESMTETKRGGMGGRGGEIQADETYYGGTSKRAKSYRKTKKGQYKAKSRVVALVDKNSGEVRAFKVKNATADTVRTILFTNADRKSILVTDDSPLYTGVGRAYEKHQVVNHTRRKYVNKDGFTTNNVENFFGVFKKGMTGVYHFCGEQHLQRYLNEFAFRYSNRVALGVSDADRAERALKGAEGKRLTYRPAH